MYVVVLVAKDGSLLAETDYIIRCVFLFSTLRQLSPCLAFISLTIPRAGRQQYLIFVWVLTLMNFVKIDALAFYCARLSSRDNIVQVNKDVARAKPGRSILTQNRVIPE